MKSKTLANTRNLAKVLKCSPERLIHANLELSLEPVLDYLKTGEGDKIPAKIREAIKNLRTLAEYVGEESETPVA